MRGINHTSCRSVRSIPVFFESTEILKLLDGGGVRALSCLYILKELMVKIKNVERSMASPAMSSFDPLPVGVDESNTVDKQGEVTTSYLPCHYIGKSTPITNLLITNMEFADYMAGTGTGRVSIKYSNKCTTKVL